MNGMRRLALLGVLAFVVGTMLSTTEVLAQQSADTKGISNVQVSPVELARALNLAFQDAVRKVMPAVVTVHTKRQAQVGSRSVAYTESGSGVVVKLTPGGPSVVLTNNHVVHGIDLDTAQFVLPDGRYLHPTRVLGDPRSDVAVVLIEEKDAYAAELGDSDQVQVGEWVLAIGTPFDLGTTVTHGIVSARGRRSLALPAVGENSSVINQDFIQTDAAIHPGNSGGPLINLEGKVIGINTAIATRSGAGEGVAFAIPSNLARTIALRLLAEKSIKRAYLGVRLDPPLDATLAEKLGLPLVRGALVSEVYAGTPAAAAGLRPFDVILRINGQPVEDEEDLRNRISLTPVGSTVELTVWRERRETTVRVTLADRDDFERSLSMAGLLSRRPVAQSLARVGIMAIDLDENLRKALGLQNSQGAVVLNVSPHAPAAVELEILDVITGVNGQAVRAVSDIDRLLQQNTGTARLSVLRVRRSGVTNRTVELEL